MRKKLLALLMCATMVLGTAVTASAAKISSGDVTNAKAIINQWDADKGAIGYEYDASTSTVTFTTEYIGPTSENLDVIYTYAFTGDNGAYVKTNKAGTKAWTKTSGVGYDIEAIDSVKHVLSLKTAWGYTSGGSTVNPSTTTNATLIGTAANATEVKNAFDKSVFLFSNSGNDSLYYVTAEVTTTAGKLGANQYVVAEDATEVNKAPNYETNADVPAGSVVVTLKSFTKAETGELIVGKDATADTNKYGFDRDNYIALEGSTISYKLSNKVAGSDYWVNIAKVTDGNATTALAQALADGTITKNAAAVQIDFFRVLNATDVNKSVANGAGTEYGFQQLAKVTAEIAPVDVTFNADWLSRSSAKTANTVFILDPYVTTWTAYYQPYGTVYKVSDLADDAFSTKYIASGVYVFDYVEPESQNDGVSDTDTTTTTTAAAATSAETAATSPKTGDVAPIAALAVVMMGACGAMVVASKKRA
jgi:hypothetical protein